MAVVIGRIVLQSMFLFLSTKEKISFYLKIIRVIRGQNSLWPEQWHKIRGKSSLFLIKDRSKFLIQELCLSAAGYLA
jgi:hypothetical protein